MSTTPHSTKDDITPAEARRRIEELVPLAQLAHRYSRVERLPRLSDGTHETDGDHVVHLGVLGLAYVLKYHPELDPGKVALAIILHDVLEAIGDDVSTLGATEDDLAQKALREKQELETLREIFVDFPELMAEIEGYEELRTPEHRAVKTFDKLTPGWTHAAEGGKMLREQGFMTAEDIRKACAAIDERMKIYGAEFPDMRALRSDMHKYQVEVGFSATSQ
jgi:5'-deoxynucleotidase YfbR-like HD superfamily hydrolase